jgi:hypothetical protein
MTDSSTFEDSLLHILNLLDKKEWQQPLSALADRFRQLPETEINIHAELLNMLYSVREVSAQDPSLPVSYLVAIKLSSMDIWCWRLVRVIDGHHKYLDPLTTPAAEFGLPLDVHQSASAFPAPDVVKRWAREHLR